MYRHQEQNPLLVSAEITSGGARLRKYLHDGKTYVVGTPERTYQFEVLNLTQGRLEIVATIDGCDTLRNVAGSTANRGLVVGPRNVARFTGWRVNNRETLEFVFGKPHHSIAAQTTGSTNNAGIIGFAVYQEEFRRNHYYNNEITRGLERGGSSLGTGSGGIQEDRVGQTTFVRASGEPQILTIYYNTEQELHRMGVIPVSSYQYPEAPVQSAFPGDDPKGYGCFRRQ